MDVEPVSPPIHMFAVGVTRGWVFTSADPVPPPFTNAYIVPAVGLVRAYENATWTHDPDADMVVELVTVFAVAPAVLIIDPVRTPAVVMKK
jgi:hypothetical protein